MYVHIHGRILRSLNTEEGQAASCVTSRKGRRYCRYAVWFYFRRMTSGSCQFTVAN